MTLILKSIDDPRDALSKARRSELAKFAHANGIKEFEFSGVRFKPEDAPAEITRTYLRSQGLTRIKVPPRILGQPNQPHANAVVTAAAQPAKSVEVSAAADLARQFQGQQGGALLDEKPVEKMSFSELHKECSERGVKRPRGAGADKLRELLRAARG